MGGPWLRLYTEIRRDRKLRRLPPAQRWLWVTILAMAKESPRPGLLLLSDGVPVTEEDLADEAFISREEVEAGLQAFKEQRMLDLSEGVWHLVNWDKRQFVSDSSTERVQRFREKAKRFNGVSETPPETDTESDSNLVGELPPAEIETAATQESLAETDESPTNRFISYWENNIGFPPSYQEILEWVDRVGQDVMIEAAKVAVEQKKRRWDYVRGILKNWYNQGVRDMESLAAFREEQEKNRASPATKGSSAMASLEEWSRREAEP